MTPCPRCSQPVSDDAASCSSCGLPLGDDVTVSSAATLASPGSGAGNPTPPRSDGTRFAPGEVLDDRYRVVGLLGEGGMGEVYRADDLTLGQSVALKFLPRGLESSPGRLERFLNEVRIARAVTHANVCRMFDIGEWRGQRFLSMEYVDGEDLSSLLRRVGRLPQERAVDVARQVCAGLAAAHAQGILHRDLKPANVMIDGRGDVRITDFGLAALSDDIEDSDIRSGTPAYMAPEQLAGEAVTDRSDIYSLGLVLYELFTGEAAIRGDTPEAIQSQHAQSTPASLSRIVDRLDPAIERVVMHCLEQRPEDRPGSALAVSAALPGGDPLAAALAAGEIPSPELLAETGASEAWSGRRATAFAALAAALIVATIVLGSSYRLFSFIDVDKPPAVLADRARDVVAALGYDEPVYADPVDQAIGFTVWYDLILEATRVDSTTYDWSRVREQPDAVNIWYRQSPWPFIPEARLGQPEFSPGPVTLMNPDQDGPGQLSVIVNAEGALRRFERMPKRLQPDTLSAEPPDWSHVFDLARLDPADFDEVPPTYQRFLVPDRRKAWRERTPRDGREPLVIEAGSIQGRVTLFNVTSPSVIQSLAYDPVGFRPSLSDWLEQEAGFVVILGILVFATVLARRSLLEGRADRRGAFRLLVLMMALVGLSHILRSHILWTSRALSDVLPILATAVFTGVGMWVWYLALEFHGRRLWPEVFAPLSRAISAPTVRLRDPLIGQSVLVGVAMGAFLALVTGPVARWVIEAVTDQTLRPVDPVWEAIVSTRVAFGHAINRVVDGVVGGLMFILVLIAARAIISKKWVSILLAIGAYSLINMSDGDAWFMSFVYAPVALLVLLRFGALAIIVGFVAFRLTNLAICADYAAWYATPAKIAIVCLATLLAIGWWAARARTAPRGAVRA